MMKIDIERLINIITEENEAYSDYMKSSVNLYKGDYKKLQERKNHLDYAYHYHDRRQDATSSVCEVFGFDAEQKNRLCIAARSVSRWYISTNWERIIPDSMKKQIARFVFGSPALDTWQQSKAYWLNDGQIGPFEIV